jgi:hypothetical protein
MKTGSCSWAALLVLSLDLALPVLSAVSLDTYPLFHTSYNAGIQGQHR